MNTTGRAPLLLVLDDDEEVGKMIAAVAHSAGFESTITATAQSLTECLRRRDPDLISLALQMPKTDGMQLLRGVADQRLAAPIVLITGADQRTIASTK